MAGGGLFIRRSQVVKQPELEYGSIGITADSTSPSTSQSNDDDDVDLTDVKSRKMSTISSGVVNLANTIVGAGMLGLPGAFGGTGCLSGIILIIVSAIFSAHGLVLLSKSAIITGKPASFYSVAHASVPRYTMLIDAAVAVKCFGVATGYLITISDSMVNALHHMLMSGDSEREPTFIISLLLSRHFWVVGAILSVLPLSFYRTLDELKKASALALVFVFMLVGMILAYANGLADPCSGSELETCKGDMEPYTNFSSTISKLPIFVFAFTCHQNIFPIVNELELLSQKRLNIVITCSICFALVIFSTVAIEGYRTYGSNVRGDILLNYPENRQVTFLRICIAGMLALHYPLQLGKCFHYVAIIIYCQIRPRMIRHIQQETIQGSIGLQFS
jgi:amino acid permease